MESLNYIIEGCRNNEPIWQKALYEKYFAFALKVAYRYIYTYDQAVDVVNDSFVKIFKNFTGFLCHDDENVEKVLLGWFKKIIVNTAIDELRRQKSTFEIVELTEQVWNHAEDSLLSEEQLFYKDIIYELKIMPPSYRTVFNMHVIDGYSHKEIAEHLGISIGTSKSSLAKAKAYLQKHLNKGFFGVDVCKN